MTTKKNAVSDRSISRRHFLKTATAVGTAATVGATSDDLNLSPIGNSDALAPAAVGIAVAGAAATDIVIEEMTGSDKEQAAQDTSQDVYDQQITQATRVRANENASRILDHQAILDGAKHLAYDEGKIKAIEALNAGKTEAEVASAAKNAATQYLSTPEENILRQWKTSVNELNGFVATADADGLNNRFNMGEDAASYDSGNIYVDSSESQYYNHTLLSGESIGLPSLDTNANYSDYWYNPVKDKNGGNRTDANITTENGPRYLKRGDWMGIHDRIETIHTEVTNGLDLWVGEIYGKVQSGEIDPAQLMSSRQMAMRADEDESLSRAKADLLALNVDVDLDREWTVEMTKQGIDWTLSGMAAATSSPSSWQKGVTYDPANNAEIGSVYMAVHSDDVVGSWDHYNTGLDGGVLTLTNEPIKGLQYVVQTTHGETAEFTAPDTSPVSGNWEVDLSGQLNQPITDVGNLSVYSLDGDTTNQWLLDEPFTIVKITDEETGEEVTETTTKEQTPTHSDSNYLTKEEWEKITEDRQQLLENIREEIEDSGGGALFGGGSLLGGIGSNMKQYFIYGGGALAALFGASFAKDLAE